MRRWREGQDQSETAVGDIAVGIKLHREGLSFALLLFKYLL